MAKITVQSMAFGNHPFRNLKNLTIEFSKRLTIIAGHNGLGKTTILALVAHTSGVPHGSTKTYFDTRFSSNIERMMHIDISEVAEAQKHKSFPKISYHVDGTELIKECTFTRRNVYQRARVVARNEGHKDVNVRGVKIGSSAKVPLPTIYLGVKRMHPVGEALEEEVSSKLDTTMHADDSKLMVDFVNAVILGGQAVNDGITNQAIKSVGKTSKQPGYSHDSRAISLGQDSLGSVATALASFNRLKRNLGAAYPGGLLIIDELDAGLHPHAIARLAEALTTAAIKLELQIIATTHSPRLIEAIHPDGGGNKHKPDKVVYLLDTANPRLADDQSLTAILADMRLDALPLTNAAKLKIPVYFEDNEAMQFLSELLPVGVRRALANSLDVQLILLPLGIGGSNLVNLPKHDPHFLNTILVVDGDTKIPNKIRQHGNALKLPGVDENNTGTSPERAIKAFLTTLAESKTPAAQAALKLLKVKNPTTDLVKQHFLTDGPQANDRLATKAWWQGVWTKLVSWQVIRVWAKENPKLIAKTKTDLTNAIKAVKARMS
jgi:predicted ATPase